MCCSSDDDGDDDIDDKTDNDNSVSDNLDTANMPTIKSEVSAAQRNNNAWQGIKLITPD